MKEHMQYIIEHADEIEKLIKVKAQVSEVKSIMLDNIDKVRSYSWNLILRCLDMCIESNYCNLQHFFLYTYYVISYLIAAICLLVSYNPVVSTLF